MSVIKFGRKFFAQIAEDVCYNRHRDRWSFLWREEDQSRFYLLKKHMTEDQKVHHIRCWVDRLFIGNQLAWAYTYGEEHTIERLQEEDFGVWGFQNFMKFCKELSSLRYNLITNGGNSFVSKTDSEKLENLISVVKTIIIQESEEYKKVEMVEVRG